jgi:hypothetical protein
MAQKDDRFSTCEMQQLQPHANRRRAAVPRCSRDLLRQRCRVAGNRQRGRTLRKTAFLRCHLDIKTIILPRQARDKHRESTQQKDVVFRTFAIAGLLV